MNSTLNRFIHQTNVFYGALNPEVTNVFFTNGEIDPWHRMGILKNLNSQSPAAFIPGKYSFLSSIYSYTKYIIYSTYVYTALLSSLNE